MLPDLTNRREFLRVAGVVGLGLGVAACGGASASQPSASPSPSRKGALTFRSRPDFAVPEVKVFHQPHTELSGLIHCTVHSPDLDGAALILDGQGRPVWILPVKDKFVENLAVQEYRGAPVLTWWQGSITASGHGEGTAMIADSTYRPLVTVEAKNGLQADLHEFKLTPQGTALITVYATVEADLSGVRGAPRQGKVLEGRVQEIDLATGALVFEWRSTEHVEVTETYAPYGHPDSDGFDYFHINSIDVEPDGNLLVSARNTWTLYRIDRKSGDLLWRLGGKKSDFAMGQGTNFEWQHDARRQADGTVTLFDDAAGPPQEEPRSRGLVLNVDETAMRASLVRAYTNGNVLASSQGNVQFLPDGTVFIGWGSEPRFTQFSQAGGILFDAGFETANQSYRTYRFPWTGKPVEAPRAVAQRASGGRLTVYASWNGATEVASWRIVAGPDAQHLAMVGEGPRTGFETAIHVTTQHPMVAAQAVDAAGNVLATTAAVSAG